MQKRQLPDGWDAEIPSFPADPKGMAGRDASGKVENAVAKRIPWLIGGAADLAPFHQDAAHVRWRRRLRSGQLQRPESPLRNSRARHGVDSERDVAVKVAALRFRFPDLQRLYARAHPAERDHGAAGHLHLHARFHRRRRRWADASAGGATDFATRDTGFDHIAAGRCQRGRGSLADDSAVPSRAGMPDPVAPEYADFGSDAAMVRLPAWPRAHIFWRPRWAANWM